MKRRDAETQRERGGFGNILPLSSASPRLRVYLLTFGTQSGTCRTCLGHIIRGLSTANHRV